MNNKDQIIPALSTVAGVALICYILMAKNEDEVKIALSLTAGVIVLCTVLRIVAVIHAKNSKKRLLESNSKSFNNIQKIQTKLHDDKQYIDSIILDLGINQTVSCSNSTVSNASNSPLKYVLKYSDIERSKDCLEKIESLINYFDDLDTLKYEVRKICASYKATMPFILKPFIGTTKLSYLLCDIEKSTYKIYAPTLTFSYVSPGGRSSSSYDIIIDSELLTEIKSELYKQISSKGHSKAQRSAMTNDLREAIKKRDNYTCQKCGNSVYDEPNLLLEVDHIIPVSKGGKTCSENLQTLCWRCNREKGNK